MQLCLDLQCAICYRFDNFIENKQAVAAINEALSFTNSEKYIYIYSQSAIGKTHLLQASCKKLLDDGKRAIFIDMNNIAEFSPELLLGLAEMDLVCIDNIHKCLGSSSWEDALFDLFNQLRSFNKPLFLSGVAAPGGEDVSLPDLHTRLCSGLIFKLVALNDYQKVSIMKARSVESGLDLNDSIANYIISSCARDLHSLLNLVEKLCEKFLSEGVRPSKALIDNINGHK